MQSDVAPRKSGPATRSSKIDFLIQPLFNLTIPTQSVELPHGFQPEEGDTVEEVMQDVSEFVRVGLVPPDNSSEVKSLELDISLLQRWHEQGSDFLPTIAAIQSLCQECTGESDLAAPGAQDIFDKASEQARESLDALVLFTGQEPVTLERHDAPEAESSDDDDSTESLGLLEGPAEQTVLSTSLFSPPFAFGAYVWDAPPAPLICLPVPAGARDPGTAAHEFPLCPRIAENDACAFGFALPRWPTGTITRETADRGPVAVLASIPGSDVAARAQTPCLPADAAAEAPGAPREAPEDDGWPGTLVAATRLVNLVKRADADDEDEARASRDAPIFTQCERVYSDAGFSFVDIQWIQQGVAGLSLPLVRDVASARLHRIAEPTVALALGRLFASGETHAGWARLVAEHPALGREEDAERCLSSLVADRLRHQAARVCAALLSPLTAVRRALVALQQAAQRENAAAAEALATALLSEDALLNITYSLGHMSRSQVVQRVAVVSLPDDAALAQLCSQTEPTAADDFVAFRETVPETWAQLNAQLGDVLLQALFDFCGTDLEQPSPADQLTELATGDKARLLDGSLQLVGGASTALLVLRVLPRLPVTAPTLVLPQQTYRTLPESLAGLAVGSSRILLPGSLGSAPLLWGLVYPDGDACSAALAFTQRELLATVCRCYGCFMGSS